MPIRRLWIALSVALWVVGCDDGGGDPEPPTPDRAVDLGAVDGMAGDMARDAALDATPDAAPDAMPDATPDAMPDAMLDMARDEGTPDPDDGVPDPDQGPPDPDDGVPDPDQGPPDPDEGVPDPDEGVPDPDEGVPDPDVGPPDPDGDIPDPDGDIPDPDGDIADPDIGPPDPDGDIPDPDGGTPDPDGDIPDPDGDIPDPDQGPPDPDEGVVIIDREPPAVAITVPADGARLLRDRVDVHGTLSEPATVRLVIGELALDAAVDGLRWSVRGAPLPQGPATLEAIATDPAGNVGRASIAITVDSVPPEVLITAPADETQTGAPTIDVEGQVIGDDVARVEVDGVAVELDDAGRFTRAAVPLQDGRTVITAAATDDFGNVGFARVAVLRDATPPTIHIETPTDGAVLTTTQVDVAGICNDFITGVTINQDDMRVWVNGIEAMVLNRTFTVPDLLLQRGANTITVEAEDRAGNRASRSIEVTVADEAGQRLVLISGQSQGARRAEPLRDPLVVSLLDHNDDPMPGRPVTFEVSRGDGTLQAFPEEGRTLTVTTDDNGLAAVSFVPGQRTGAGSHRVVARADGFLGRVEFCTSVYAGDPVQVLTVAGHQQVGRAGGALPEPFTAMVTDGAGNPVDGVEVTFTVIRGGGVFSEGAEGADSTLATSDSDGLARATLTLGPDGGANVVLATIEGLVDAGEQGAAFHAEGLVAGARADTRVVGQVLDNQDQPIEGVIAWIRLEDGPVLSDVSGADGRFAITDVPVGAVHLVVDGAPAEPLGEWPTLTYDLVTTAGADNSIGGPVYLPRLDPDGTAVVGGDDDVTLRLRGVVGAELTVFGGSVTCLDGSATCELTWSQVRGERVPDPAPMGSSFDMVATLQPPGVRFDPPARLCVPNRGNPPGYQQEMFGYDHDLGDWVGLGTGTVTADGRQICSDTGFGLHKSGWHGTPPPPPPPKCPSDCSTDNPCQTGSCVDGSCKYEPKGDGTKCDDGSGCGEATCQGGSCVFESTEEDGTECDDNDACTETSECQGGACVGGDQLDCEDDDPCTEDSCDAANGCMNDPKPDGSSCEGEHDGVTCIDGFECRGGSCEQVEKECEEDENPCTEAACEEGECVQNPAMEGEECGDEGGECGLYTCQEGECNPADEQPDTEGEECDDDNECTEDDRCQSGECKGDDKPIITEAIRPIDVSFAVRIPELARRVEAAVSRIAPFKFRLGGDFGIQGTKSDCCNEQDGEFIEQGKKSATARFNFGARITAPVGPLGFVKDFRVDAGGATVDLQVEVGITFDVTLGLDGSAGTEENECTGQDDCTTVNGSVSLGGAIRAGVFVRACIHAGSLFSVCPNVRVEPGRLQLSITGGGGWRSGGCGNPGFSGSVNIGRLVFVARFNLVVTQYTLSQTLFDGFTVRL